MSDENKSWSKKILGAFISSPVSSIFLLFLLYFTIKGYVFNGASSDKLTVWLIMFLWAVWFMARYIITVIVVVMLIAAGFWTYYSYSHRAENECKQNGGVWNQATQTCEEKTGVVGYFEKLWKDYKSGK